MDQLSPLLDLLSTSFLAFLAFGRLQIRESGIWSYWGLTQWRDIEAYRWKDKSTLVLEHEGWFSLPKSGFVVPPQHRKIFEEYLLQHVEQSALDN